METVKICPRCGKPLGANQLDGLCPECLLAAGIGSVAPPPTGKAPPSSRESGFVPPTPAELAPNFPNLEILELLGKGGMGAVYKARQRDLDRMIALKILPPEVGRDPAFAERFTREARALARLNHPNIVTVHEFGQSGGLFYFIMEYIDGATLRHLLQNQNLSPREAMEIVPHICEALQYAHDEGIVHRDIKPENILIDKKGRVKIADFGLAKLAGAAAPLTRTADVMGTPQYMAPEQFEHPLEVDHRADIYSLGVVFYEMLTGELPLGRFAPPSRKVRVDVRLDDVVLRALEKEPELRYQQASQMKTQVETISTTTASPNSAAALAGSSAGAAAAPAGTPQLPAAAAQVQGPATSLMIIGGLNILGAMVGAVIFVPLLLFKAAPVHDMAIRPVWGGIIPLLAGVGDWIALAAGGLAIAGAVAMKRLQHYRLAFAGSLLVLFCSPSNILGIAVGIWSLVVLSRKEVREAFQQVASGAVAYPAYVSGAKAKSSKGWLVVAVAVLLVLTLIPLAFMAAWWVIPIRSSARAPIIIEERHLTPAPPTTRPSPMPPTRDLNRNLPLGESANLHWRLTEAARKVVQSQAIRYRYESIQVETDPDQKQAKLTFTELKDSANNVPAEGGFDAAKNPDGSWELQGWGAFEKLKSRMNANE